MNHHATNLTYFAFEYFRAVDVFVEACGHDGWNDASDQNDCVLELREATITDGKLTREQADELAIDAEFVEFDSGNPNHANAVFRVSIMAPSALAPQIRQTFKGELDCAEENE